MLVAQRGPPPFPKAVPASENSHAPPDGLYQHNTAAADNATLLRTPVR